MPDNKDLAALISMLDEPDEKTFGHIRSNIVGLGEVALPLLEEAWGNNFDNLVQARIESIIHHIQLDKVHHDLAAWRSKGSFRLLEGVIGVTSYQYPGLQLEQLAGRVEEIRKNIWLELNSNLTALEKVKVMNHILYGLMKLRLAKNNPQPPSAHFLNNLLQTRKGTLMSLAILYLCLAQSLDLPVYGIDIPNYFVLAYVDELHNEHLVSGNDQEVLFYINPGNQGAVFTHKEIESYLKYLKMKPDRHYFLPCSNLDILKKYITGLALSYEKTGQPEKAAEVKGLLEELGEEGSAGKV